MKDIHTAWKTFIHRYIPKDDELCGIITSASVVGRMAKDSG